MALLAKITMEAATAGDAFELLRALSRSKRKRDTDAEYLAESAERRVDHNELSLPEHAPVSEFLNWVETNLESEEGLLDYDAPAHLHKAIKDAVALLNDPLLPLPCVRSSEVANGWVFFDRR